MSELIWHDAELSKPDIGDVGCSEDVLVIRDCGDNTIPSYSISRYRPIGWYRSTFFWLDQESRGYRVVKWAYLPQIESLKMEESDSE